MPRPLKPHTQIGFRISVELADWFKDYAEHQGVSMSQIIKNHLEAIRRKSERARRKDKGEATP